MGSKVKKILGKVAPIAAAFIPGIGPLAAAAIGAGSGLLSGGGLKGAVLGGVTGGLGGGFGSQIGGSILGQAASTAASRGIGGALTGAAGGLLSGGGLKSAALGAAVGGAGGYTLGGGLDNTMLGRAADSAYQGISSGIGSGFDGLSSGLSNIGSSLGINDAYNSVSSGISDVGNSLGIGGGTSSYLPGQIASRDLPAPSFLESGSVAAAAPSTSSYGGLGSLSSNVFSGVSATNANDDVEKALLAAQDKNSELYSPYINAKFEPGDLTQDPGYQFQQKQGLDAIDKANAARGNFYSGAALQDAAKFNNGLADSTYNAAYERFLRQNQQNLGAAGAQAGVNNDVGNAIAGNDIANSNVFSQALSGILGGKGIGTNGQMLGGSDDLAALLARYRAMGSYA